MGFLQQDSTSISDSEGFTFSTWVKVLDDISVATPDTPYNDPLLGANFLLFEFGFPTGYDSFIGFKWQDPNGVVPGGGYCVLAMLVGNSWNDPGYDVGFWSHTAFDAPFDLNYIAPDHPDGIAYDGFGDPGNTGSYFPINISPGAFSVGEVFRFQNSGGIGTGNKYIWGTGHAGAVTNTGLVYAATNQTFLPGGPSNVPFGGPQLTPNIWHHLFVSCDLSEGIVSKGASTIDGSGVIHSDNVNQNFVYNPFNIYLDNAQAINYDVPNFFGAPTLFGNIAGAFKLSPAGQPTAGAGALVDGFPITSPGTYPQASTWTTFSGSNLAETIPVRKNFAYTQVWFNQYIDPTGTTNSAPNLSYFRTVVSGGIIPPSDIFAAQKAFGKSDIYFVRDKLKNLNYQTNQGTGGSFSVIGTPPTDYTPGPGQAGTPGLMLPHERDALVAKGANLSLHRHL